MSQVQRKLTTILAADAASYSSVMEADEVGTLSALRAARAVFAQFIARHRGRIANTAGDGLIAEFPSVVEAVQCAVEVQREIGDHVADVDAQVRDFDAGDDAAFLWPRSGPVAGLGVAADES